MAGYDNVIPPNEVIDNLRKWLENLEGLQVYPTKVKDITAEAYDRKNKATEQLIREMKKDKEKHNTLVLELQKQLEEKDKEYQMRMDDLQKEQAKKKHKTKNLIIK